MYMPVISPGRAPEHAFVGGIGEAVDEMLVPVADQRGHHVEHRLQHGLGLVQRMGALLDGQLQFLVDAMQLAFDALSRVISRSMKALPIDFRLRSRNGNSSAEA
jgi:hypothetical protein